jgi:homogentisate 1,2-dioxygenase
MPHYQRVGDVPPKRHTQFRSPDGDLYAEELMGSEGFSSSSSLLYHRRPPTAIVGAETVNGAAGAGLRPNEPLLPRHLRTGGLPETADLVTGPAACTATPRATRSSTSAPGPPGWSRRSAPSPPGPATT